MKTKKYRIEYMSSSTAGTYKQTSFPDSLRDANWMKKELEKLAHVSDVKLIIFEKEVQG